MRNVQTVVVVLVLWAGAATPSEVTAAPPEVTPYRPTVSNPAALSAPGLFELELGGVGQDGDSGSHSYGLPYLLKYAFTEDVGLLLGGDAYLHQKDADGSHRAGGGDTVVALKLRHALSDSATVGLEAGVRLATADTGLGAERHDYLLNAIYSARWAGLDFDFNLAHTRLGQANPGEGRSEIGWAAGVAGALGGRWGWALEVSGTRRHGVRSTAQALAAISYQPTRTLMFDMGLARSLISHADETTVFAGFSILFGR